MWELMWDIIYQFKMPVMVGLFLVNLGIELFLVSKGVELEIIFAVIVVQVNMFIIAMCYAAWRIERMVQEGQNVYRG